MVMGGVGNGRIGRYGMDVCGGLLCCGVGVYTTKMLL